MQAVEKFSANTQEISASLRAFTQKLQETEFPNDVNSTDELLRSQVSPRSPPFVRCYDDRLYVSEFFFTSVPIYYYVSDVVAAATL